MEADSVQQQCAMGSSLERYDFLTQP